MKLYLSQKRQYLHFTSQFLGVLGKTGQKFLYFHCWTFENALEDSILQLCVCGGYAECYFLSQFSYYMYLKFMMPKFNVIQHSDESFIIFFAKDE